MVRVDNVPDGDAWLHPEERCVLAALTVDKRRREWRAGRWAAKQAVAAELGVELTDVEVRAAGDGAPEPFVAGEAVPLSLSISHSGDRAACLLASTPVQAGCDLERIEPRAPVFVDDFFTQAERRLVAAATGDIRDLVVTLVWSAKESALKALRCGLRRDTRSVEVALGDEGEDGWRALRVRDFEGSRTLYGWWRRCDDAVLTAVASAPSPPPVLLGSGDP
jgi:4'-phosphopantetheinyl transferase